MLILRIKDQTFIYGSQTPFSLDVRFQRKRWAQGGILLGGGLGYRALIIGLFRKCICMGFYLYVVTEGGAEALSLTIV